MTKRPLTPRALQIRAALARHDRGDATLEEITAELGVKPSTLAWWRSELRRIDDDAGVASFVELKVEREVQARPLVVELGALRIVVAAGFDDEHLVRTIKALQRC